MIILRNFKRLYRANDNGIDVIKHKKTRELFYLDKKNNSLLKSRYSSERAARSEAIYRNETRQYYANPANGKPSNFNFNNKTFNKMKRY